MEEESYDETKDCNSYAFAGDVAKINLTQLDGTTVYRGTLILPVKL